MNKIESSLLAAVGRGSSSSQTAQTLSYGERESRVTTMKDCAVTAPLRLARLKTCRDRERPSVMTEYG